MIVDFHIHYSPEELVRPKLGPGGTPRTIFVNGVPTQMPQQQLFALENHIVAMDEAGVDLAVLSSPSGLVDDLDQCRMVNDNLKRVEDRFPGRLQGMAHVPALGGEQSLREFDMGGCFGNINPVKCALVEIDPEKLLLGTDYPQEMRDGKSIKRFIDEIKKLPVSQYQINGMLGENGKQFLKNL